MAKQKKILISIGTRPEIIKMAPVYHELRKAGAAPLLLHTGQHTTMATSLYKFFNIVPDYSITLNRKYTANPDELSGLSSILLENISSIMNEVDPGIVMVHGDTSSALMSGLAAFYQQRPVAHVEAGLRSHNKYDPFPEENNRILLAQLAEWHFAPTLRAKQNLIREGISEKYIYLSGNTIVEAATMGISKLGSYYGRDSNKSDLISQLKPNLQNKKMLLVTAHRRENQKSNIKLIAEAICELLAKHKELIMVWPVHPNPVVNKVVYSVISNMPKEVLDRTYLTQPLEYQALLWVLKNSWLVLTDSGGIQEEAISLNIPILILRETTERPEIVEAKAGILVGTKKEKIISQVENLLQNNKTYESMRKAKNPYGNGTTAKYICETLFEGAVKTKKYMRAVSISFLFLVGMTGLPDIACSDENNNESAYKPNGYVEAGVNYSAITNHYGDWSGEYLRGEVQTDANNRWSGEMINQKEFNDSGNYGSIGNTHIYNPDWFSSVTIGAGNEGFFLPRYRVDAFLNRKFLDQKQLIGTVGFGTYKAMDAHDDNSLFLGASYYFSVPWIVQGGIRFNNSNPGGVNSTSEFIAVTQGKDKDYFVTARYGFGTEAYQSIGPGQTISNFQSSEVSLQLRKWVNAHGGFNIIGEKYYNPNYKRTGITAGIFMEF